jgi:hypothetical protein
MRRDQPVFSVFDQNLKASRRWERKTHITTGWTTMAETVRETADQANFMMLLAGGSGVAQYRRFQAHMRRRIISSRSDYGQMLLAQYSLGNRVFIACLFLV